MPSPRTRSPKLLPAALLAWMLVGCDEPPPAVPSFEDVAEPGDPLRPPSVRGLVPDHARIADYWIDARLDAERHEVAGTLRLAWRNRTERSVDRLPFHLYMNGFRAEDTAWMSGARGKHRGQRFARDRWGFVHVERVHQLARSQDEPPPLSFERAPSPGLPLQFSEDADPSTMTVQLPEPVGPGEAIVLEIEFLTRLPQVFARTGYYDDFHMVAQWFPKIGVLEEAGGWQAHVFTLNAEFYADFGNYEVRLDVPSEMLVGASGVLVSEAELDDQRKRLHYRASMVHDFAWAADPDFIEHEAEYEGIRIRQLLQPSNADEAEAHLGAQVIALASMQERFGPYPWSTITIVHAPEGAEGAGGMEYPTLYTTSAIPSSPWLPKALLEERVAGVFTTVHEFGHQYFQGMFASNEHAQPWLDEGMNTFANMLVYRDAYAGESRGERPDPWLVRLLGHELSVDDLILLSIAQTGDREPIDQPADRWSFEANAYGSVTYQKTAALFLTLRGLVGEQAFDAAMAEYARQARFQHPTGMQLERVLIEEIVRAQGGEGSRIALLSSQPSGAEPGEGGPGTVWFDIAAFLDEGLRGVGLLDVRILEVGNRRRQGHSGWHRIDRGAPEAPEPPAEQLALQQLGELFGRTPPEGPAELRLEPSGPSWSMPVEKLPDEQVEGVVVLQRRSPLQAPVEVLVEFADGTRTTRLWDGQAHLHTLSFPGQRVIRAQLDPKRRLLIAPERLDDAAWATDYAERPEEALPAWIADVSEATELALLGGLGI